jgi:NAD-dependent DNA ligase
VNNLDLKARASTNRLLQRGCESLIGICSGLIADGELNDKEITYLRLWLKENSELCDSWPAEVIFRRVEDVLADGQITSEERSYLKETLENLVGGSFTDTGAVQTGSTALPVNENAVVKITDNSFCFTGQFVFGTRGACEKATTNLGGKCSSLINKKINYLVIGEMASRDWKYSSHGLKIQQAIALQSQGLNLHIISEAMWFAEIK